MFLPVVCHLTASVVPIWCSKITRITCLMCFLCLLHVKGSDWFLVRRNWTRNGRDLALQPTELFMGPPNDRLKARSDPKMDVWIVSVQWFSLHEIINEFMNVLEELYSLFLVGCGRQKAVKRPKSMYTDLFQSKHTVKTHATASKHSKVHSYKYNRRHCDKGLLIHVSYSLRKRT